MKVRFGACLFDDATRQLVRDGREQHLSPKAFELLKFLIEQRPKALSKAELHQQIWPAVFVSDDSLAKLVAEIRAMIGDDAREPRFLRTVYGYGYAFTDAEVLETMRAASTGRVKYWLTWQGREAQLRTGENIIGRDADVDICLDSPRVSRNHARIVVSEAHALLEDLGSKNATFLRGARIVAPTALEHGDEIRIGPFILACRISRPAVSTETEST